jgi:hypothetical protein
MVPVPPRALAADERRVLTFLLSDPFPGRDELQVQADMARVVGCCSCGCPSLALAVGSSAVPAAPTHADLPVEVRGVNAEGAEYDLMLWVRDGYLDWIEVVTYGEEVVGFADLVLRDRWVHDAG